MKNLMTIIVMLLTSSLVFAGSPEFTVKQIKGDAQLKNGSSWEKLSNGKNLKISDQIKLSDGSVVTLEHSSGKSINVNKSGFYSIAKLSAKTKTKNTNVSSKLANSLLDELSDSDDMLATGNASEKMSTLGAVERAFGNKFTTSAIVAGLPRSSFAINNTLNFAWYPLERASSYKLIIKNGSDEVIYTKEVNTTETQINLDEANVPYDECYYWLVSSGDKISEEFCIFRMNNELATNLNQELTNLKAELDLNNSLDNMILAKFFANNNLVNEATTHFQKAIEIDENVEAYRVMYAKYLLSLGLNDEAMEMVNK